MAERHEDGQTQSVEPNSSDTAPLLEEQEENLPPPPFNPSGKLLTIAIFIVLRSNFIQNKSILHRVNFVIVDRA